MLQVLCLAAVLLSSCAGETSDKGWEKIQAVAGDTVILPCNIAVHGEVPAVEWTKEGPTPIIAFLYRDGCETFEMKNQVFQYRTSLFMNELGNGNISLRISNVQPSDTGKYQCKNLQGLNRQVVRTLELFVGVVSELNLSGVGAGVLLQCDAKCWSLEPEITFPSKKDQGSRGCFTISRRVTLLTATRGFNCTVHQSKSNHSRDTEIDTPDNCTDSCSVICIIVAVIILIIFVSVLSIYIKCHSAFGTRKPPGHCTTRQNAEVQTDNTENARELERLKLHLCEMEKIIQQKNEQLRHLSSRCQHCQRERNKSPSKSSLSQFPHGNSPNPTALSNKTHPKSDTSLQKNTSKPGVAIQNPTLVPEVKGVSLPPTSGQPVRSKSLSMSHLHLNGGRRQRSNTISSYSQNRFIALADLPEDFQPLI